MSGCLGIGEETVTSAPQAGEVEYSTSNFSLLVPQDWEIIEEASFTSGIPSETLVDFRNNIKSDIFTANVNIAMMDVDEDMTASDLAISSKARAESSLVSFELVSLIDLEIPYGEIFKPGARLIFSGKKSASDPIVYFDQLYIIHNGLGFVVTSASLLEEDETVVNYLDRMLNSFALK